MARTDELRRELVNLAAQLGNTEITHEEAAERLLYLASRICHEDPIVVNCETRGVSSW